MTLGRTAYEAYRRFRADPYIVGWFELPRAVQDAWEASAEGVYEAGRTALREEFDDEAFNCGYEQALIDHNLAT